MSLRLDWCSHEAAKYAVMNWHYSKVMPAGKLVKVGAWEDAQFVGSIIFGLGANRNIATPFGLDRWDVCELVQVALCRHCSATSQIVSLAMKKLKAQSENLRLVISYADPGVGHVGTVYQAMNWIYIGHSRPQRACLIDGIAVHKKSATVRRGTIKGLPMGAVTWKHKYLYPLDKAMRKQIEPLRQPYPKRVPSDTSDTPGHHPGEGGATPTGTLHSPNS